MQNLDDIGMTEFEIFMEVSKKNRQWRHWINDEKKESIYTKYTGRSPTQFCIPDMWWRTLDDLEKVRISEIG